VNPRRFFAELKRRKVYSRIHLLKLSRNIIGSSKPARAAEDFVDVAWLALLKDKRPLMETHLPRRRFLAGSALVACGLLLPRAYGILHSADVDPAAVALSYGDQVIKAELELYGANVRLWKGADNFSPRWRNPPRTKKFINFLVRVTDFPGLSRYLNLGRLNRLGVVYAGGPNLAFVVGNTAYTVTNFGPHDFERAIT
jgi:hypothetical protein